jgi:hypothetical protein
MGRAPADRPELNSNARNAAVTRAADATSFTFFL